MNQDTIAVIDLGSARTTEIARAIRAIGVYTELHPHDLDAGQLAAIPNLRGLVLASGPRRAYEGQVVEPSPAILESGLPLLAVDDAGDPEPDLAAFVFKTGATRNWDMANFIDDQVEAIRAQVGDGKVLLALSGGVDSSVVAALLIRAIGKQLTCVHVNHGLLRKGESEQVIRVFREGLGANLVYVDATERFLGKLAGVADPEQKRKIIGAEFIRVFEEEARKLDGIAFLGQGTIYPDIIESGTKTAKAVKSHHNVGGLPPDLRFALVEPLKMLFKDEVRACGLALGLPEAMVNRQPFPGPGLGVRCLGALDRGKLDILREADDIFVEEIKAAGLYHKLWQAFCVFLPVRSVGVMGDQRTYDYVVALRAVTSTDGMTADWAALPEPLIRRVSARIVNEVRGVNRVVLDVTSKPPGTIEWE